MLAIALLCWIRARRWSMRALRWRWRLLTVFPFYLAQLVVATAIMGGGTELLWLAAVDVPARNIPERPSFQLVAAGSPTGAAPIEVKTARSDSAGRSGIWDTRRR